jgi:hypothetical protein
MNNGKTKVNVSSDYAYRILTNSLKTNNISGSLMKTSRIEILKLLLRTYIILPTNKHTI